MPSNNRLRRHKRKDASGDAKAAVEGQLAPADNIEESEILEVLPTQLTKIDLKPRTALAESCDSESSQSHWDAQTSGDHRSVERLASPETNGRNKDAAKVKDNEIKQQASHGNLMAEDGPWNDVSLSSDEERDGWIKISRNDYEVEQHAVSDKKHDVSQKAAGACIGDDYGHLDEEDWELVDDESTSVDV